VTDAQIAQVFTVMADTPHHTYQILTKRAERMQEYLRRYHLVPLPNVWAGVSIEDERAAKERLPILRETPAAVRFLSCEPLLSPLGDLDLTGIHWAIAGGESGPGYRPMRMEWARQIRDACKTYGTAFFFKQDSGSRTEMRPWLVEEDGSRWTWHQMPGDLREPAIAW
jgi:protein gp37